LSERLNGLSTGHSIVNLLRNQIEPPS
jgi:hypothetical protein